MSLKEDIKVCEQMFTETHGEETETPQYVTMKDVEAMLKGFTEQKTPDKQEAVENPIGLTTDCPHCHKTFELQGIDGDEMFKALNDTLGAMLTKLVDVEKRVELNETIVKGVAGFIRLGEKLASEIEELKKGFVATEKTETEEGTTTEPETEVADEEKVEERPVAKGVTMGVSPRQQKVAEVLGNMSGEMFQEAIRKAVDDGIVPVETEAWACSAPSLLDLISNPDIVKAIEHVTKKEG